MKSVLISIQPKWVEKIASGKKTIEVRKTRPKMQTPFKCYIYCTNGNGTLNDTLMSGDRRFVLNQKVIGEFVCDRIKKLNIPIRNTTTSDMVIFSAESCLSVEKLTNYIGNGQDGYGWHISDLKIYDKPKELSEFKTFCKNYYDGNCEDCKYCIDGRGYEYDESDCGCNGLKPIERPPQSYMFIETGESL